MWIKKIGGMNMVSIDAKAQESLAFLYEGIFTRAACEFGERRVLFWVRFRWRVRVLLSKREKTAMDAADLEMNLSDLIEASGCL